MFTKHVTIATIPVVGLPWALNFVKKASKPDQAKETKDNNVSTVSVGLSSVVMDNHDNRKDNTQLPSNSPEGASSDHNSSSDSTNSSSGPLVEFSSQTVAKESRFVYRET